MAADKHIERIGDTDANIRANLDTLQIAIQTDSEETFVWANNGATFYHYAAAQYKKDAGGAVTYLDAKFNDLTANGDLFANEYIKRDGDAADYIRFENDKISTSAGGNVNLIVEDDRVLVEDDLVIGKGSLYSGYIIQDSAETSTTTAVTQATLNSLSLTDDSVYHIKTFIVGNQSDGSNRASYESVGTFYRAGAGSATLQGAITSLHAVESNADWSAKLEANGDTVRSFVSHGPTAATVYWGGTMKYSKLTL